jgi:hypothetical protein
LGDPKAIRLPGRKIVYRGEDEYTLDELPRLYVMAFGDMDFWVDGDSIIGIGVRKSRYEFANGLGVGDSGHKLRQALGSEFDGSEFRPEYPDKGVVCEIDEETGTVTGIGVYLPKYGRGTDSASPNEGGLPKLIVPGVRVGEFTLGMSKDKVLTKLGKPQFSYYGGEQYTLDNLPERYRLFYGHIEFQVHENSVEKIKALDSTYTLFNGLGVGASEEEFKQVFGEDFDLAKAPGEDYFAYDDDGVAFVVQKEDRTVIEIIVFLARPKATPNAEGSEDK